MHNIYVQTKIEANADAGLISGIGNLILSHLTSAGVGDGPETQKKVHFYSSSGGNAGLAAVVAARELDCPCTVVVPMSTKPMMVQKLHDAGATEVIQHGASWYEADRYLWERFFDVPGRRINSKTAGLKSAGTTNNPVTVAGSQQQDETVRSEIPDVTVTAEEEVQNVYVPPFDHPLIWEGVATLVEELARQLPPRDPFVDISSHPTGYRRQADGVSDLELPPPFPADVIVCSVGGGGLFNGVISGLDKHVNQNGRTKSDSQLPVKPVHVIAAETEGADSLAYSLRNDSVQSLQTITSLATSLGALKVAEQTFRNARNPPPGIKVSNVVTGDFECARGVITLAETTRLMVELASGICVDIAVGKRLKELVPDLTPDTRVVVILCGGSNITSEMICDFRRRLKDGWNES
jgi:L-serine/L-threonine ammonia-lyase